MENSDSEGEERGEQLSPEQTDKLVQLQVTVLHRHTAAPGSVQGLTGQEDLEVCRALLESQGWDLEAVAREHLGIGEQGEEEPPVREEPPPGPAPLGAGGGAVWRPQGTAGWLLYILSLPARS